MTVRIPIESLPEEAREALERGESVELEREGEILGRIECPGPARSGEARHAEYLRRLRADPPVDYDELLADLEMTRMELNRPAELRHWDW
jgi:hypothetical protein